MIDTLNTNEVKQRAGTEVEFIHAGTGPGRNKAWQASSATPALPHRISLKHTEEGSGTNTVRRSVIRVDKTLTDGTGTLFKTASAYVVVQVPEGILSNYDDIKDILAELGSLVHTLGTNTHLYDGTGTGAVALINGTL